MTIQTELTPKDWTAFQRFQLMEMRRRAPGRAILATFALAAVGIGFASQFLRSIPSLKGAMHQASFVAGSGVTALVGLVMIVPVVILSRHRQSAMFPRGGSLLLGPREIHVSDEGIRESSRLYDSSFRWETVFSVVETPEHLFVILDPAVAMIVPCRAFAHEVEREQFTQEIRRRCNPSPMP